jgi:hypothetical protein
MQKCAYAYQAGATVGNTPAHIQGTDANGAPQRITPTDLASLLGVLSGFPTDINTANYDLNDAPHGYVVIGHDAKSTVVNNPFGHEVVGVITIHRNATGVGDIRLQIVYRDNSVKMRCYWISTWGAWKDVM